MLKIIIEEKTDIIDICLSGIISSGLFNENEVLSGVSNSSGIFNRCNSIGSVTALNNDGQAAGFGQDTYSYGSFTNCYSWGNVIAGSVSGIGSGFGLGDLTNCYSIGTVDGFATGGLCGLATEETATASYWDTQNSEESSSTLGIGNNTSWMQTKSNYETNGWDFDDVWEMSEGGGTTLDKIIPEIIEQTGTDDFEIDTDDIASIECGGMLVDQLQPASDVINAILDCYDLIVRQDNGVLTFLQRGNEDQYVLNADDLSAHEPNKTVDKLWNIGDTSDINLPREVTVNFFDAGVEWDKGAVNYRKTLGKTESKESFSFPITMLPDEARYIARRRCLSAYLNRNPISINLPPKWVTLKENDILLIPDGDEYIVMRVQNATRGFNYMLEVKGIIDNSRDSDFAMAAAIKNNSQTIKLPVPVGFVLIDICSLNDANLNIPGYYTAAYSFDRTLSFGGALFYDGTINIQNFIFGSTSGIVADALGLAGGYTWDRVNKITVELFNGTLESVTESQCLAGSNRALLGNELIGFQNATLVAANTYELSLLLRGLGDTRDQIDSHEADEVFLLLESGKIKFKAMNNNEIGMEKSFKVLAPGEYFDDVEAIDLTTNANNLRPFAPCYIRTSFDTDGNLNIDWCRRTRSQVELLTTLPIPLSEETEAYEIDIIVDSEVIRTIEADSETCQYTSAQMVTDGVSKNDIESVRIYQMSAIVGRGKPGVKIL